MVTTYSDVYLYRGYGGGPFHLAVSIFNSFSLGYIVVAARRRPSRDDVVVSRGCCGNVEILTLLNQGDGTFELPASTPLPEDVRYMLSGRHDQ